MAFSSHRELVSGGSGKQKRCHRRGMLHCGSTTDAEAMLSARGGYEARPVSEPAGPVRSRLTAAVEQGNPECRQ
jgi:hypothetical protein